MDPVLLQKYFNNECTVDEIAEVTDWFQTEEGQDYLEKQLDEDMSRYADGENVLLHPNVPSEEMLRSIESAINNGHSRVASPAEDRGKGVQP